MAKRRYRGKPEQPQTQEELIAEHRRRCRGPEWWSKYSDEELSHLQRRGQTLREKGADFIDWSDVIGER